MLGTVILVILLLLLAILNDVETEDLAATLINKLIGSDKSICWLECSNNWYWLNAKNGRGLSQKKFTCYYCEIYKIKNQLLHNVIIDTHNQIQDV